MRLDEPGRRRREGGRERREQRGGWDGEEGREEWVKRHEIKRNVRRALAQKVKSRI